jgi:aryl-alcohol dehydrogenase-like predicted oxidoreductase
MNPKGHNNPNLSRGLSAAKIIRGCEGSLRRMKVDYIDLYQMHHIDRTCPWDEIWQAMETLVRQGKILYVGSSNFAGWDIATANQVASQRHFLGLVSEQSVYNLETRTIELEVIPACRHYGLGLMIWSPLSQGLLAGSLKKLQQGRRSGKDFEKRVMAKQDQLKAYESLCRKLKANPAIVGLSWLLHNPAVTCPIVGPRTVAQLVESMAALDLKLDPATLKKLDEIWPGPGGEAPRAYAW